MAGKPLTFGVRMRSKGRTVRVRASGRKSGRYTVEVQREGGRNDRREHASLGSALRDCAQAWRNRLH